jgi:hypothetical protein
VPRVHHGEIVFRKAQKAPRIGLGEFGFELARIVAVVKRNDLFGWDAGVDERFSGQFTVRSDAQKSRVRSDFAEQRRGVRIFLGQQAVGFEHGRPPRASVMSTGRMLRL